jgi:hypothetical protein
MTLYYTDKSKTVRRIDGRGRYYCLPEDYGFSLYDPSIQTLDDFRKRVGTKLTDEMTQIPDTAVILRGIKETK